MGHDLLRTAYDDLVAALARIDELSRTAPPNPLWIARRGEILERAGRDDEARTEFTRALALIAQRSPQRRGQPFAELKQKLETALASAEHKGGKP